MPKKNKAKPVALTTPLSTEPASRFELDVWQALSGSGRWHWAVRRHVGAETQKLVQGEDATRRGARIEGEAAALKYDLVAVFSRQDTIGEHVELRETASHK